MRELLLINNEPTPEDRGRIARAGELGLTDPLYNIDALAAKLAAFGTVTVRHYTQLRTLDSAPDAIFLSGCFTDWDRERLRETFADELALIRETTAPLFGICAGLQLIGIAFGAPLVYPGEGYEEFGFLPQTVLAQHPLTAGLAVRSIVLSTIAASSARCRGAFACSLPGKIAVCRCLRTSRAPSLARSSTRSCRMTRTETDNAFWKISLPTMSNDCKSRRRAALFLRAGISGDAAA